MLNLDVTETTGHHNWLVITPHTLTGLNLKGSEVAAQIRTSKLIVKRGSSQGAFGHNLTRCHDTIGLSVVQFPRTRVLF